MLRYFLAGSVYTTVTLCMQFKSPARRMGFLLCNPSVLIEGSGSGGIAIACQRSGVIQGTASITACLKGRAICERILLRKR